MLAEVLTVERVEPSGSKLTRKLVGFPRRQALSVQFKVQGLRSPKASSTARKLYDSLVPRFCFLSDR
jgi:hypothetical protein